MWQNTISFLVVATFASIYVLGIYTMFPSLLCKVHFSKKMVVVVIMIWRQFIVGMCFTSSSGIESLKIHNPEFYLRILQTHCSLSLRLWKWHTVQLFTDTFALRKRNVKVHQGCRLYCNVYPQIWIIQTDYVQWNKLSLLPGWRGQMHHHPQIAFLNLDVNCKSA